MKPVSWSDPNAFWRLLVSDVPPGLFPRHEKKLQYFRYADHELGPGQTRSSVRLMTTDTMIGLVQKITDGTGTPLHLHATLDGFWMVLQGRASFMGEDGVEHELAPYEGVSVPRGTAYAFKQVGQEPLHLLQVETVHKAKRHVTKFLVDRPAEDRQRAFDSWALFDARLD
ncbi:MAG: cupin domain-containing protein [Alphaproteobacteria bacterium]|nr:cupin domain-containing protein [Alphaproteobacteria bacterium]